MKLVVSKEGEILQKVYHDVSVEEGIGIIANECTHGAIDPLLLVEMRFSSSGKIKTILYTFSEEREGLK